MRVTAGTKRATRKRILEAARQRFGTHGFEASTTRDIADAAGIATGTLFNYFPTKEAILASLVAEAVAPVHQEFDGEARSAESLEEDLFAFVMSGLRKLKSLRKQLTVLLETALSPLATVSDDEAQSLRASHLEVVASLAKKHLRTELPPLALQLYWTLYTGVLIFWANDRSPKQEDTLALLDQTLAMFVGWLQRDSGEPSTPTKGELESCPQR
jgi:AcrR family transcriptional regulator